MDDNMTGFAQPKLHTIGVVVKNMPRSIGFYRLLGVVSHDIVYRSWGERDEGLARYGSRY